MTESPQQPKKQNPIIAKLDTKFVQFLGKYGMMVDIPAARSYFFPVVVIKHSASPVGVYQLVDFKDLPDELLAKFGLQKISATPAIPQYRCFKEGEIIEEFDRYMNEDGELEAFHPNSIGKAPVDSFVNNPKFLKFVKTEPNEEAIQE